MALERKGYPAFNSFPVTGPAISPRRAIDATTGGVRVTLSGSAFSVRLQISNAQAVNVPEHLFIPPEESWETYATLTSPDVPAFVSPPVRWVRLLLDSGTVTGGNVEESTRVTPMVDDAVVQAYVAGRVSVELPAEVADKLPPFLEAQVAPLRAALPAVRVASVAALRARNNDGSPVQTLGYHGSLAGGGGLYDPDPSDTTSGDNGGLVLVGADGTRYKLRHNGTVTPRVFGARGAEQPGVDDRPALQAALTQASGAGLTVELPAPDVYMLRTFTNASTKTLLYAFKNTRLSGAGTIKLPGGIGAWKELFAQADPSTQAFDGALFTGFTIDCNNGENPLTVDPNLETDPRRVFHFHTGRGLTFSNLTVKRWTGVHLWALNRVQFSSITGCRVLDAGVGHAGIVYDSSMIYTNGQGQIITGNEFHAFDGQGIRTCAELHGEHVTFADNILHNWQTSVIVASDAVLGGMSNVRVSNNQLLNTGAGVSLWAVGGEIRDLAVTGNTITINRTMTQTLPQGTAGIALYPDNTSGFDGLDISDNAVRFLADGMNAPTDDGTVGIALDAAQQFVVGLKLTGNTVVDAPAHGLSVRFAKLVAGEIARNTVRNPRASTAAAAGNGLLLAGNTYSGTVVQGNRFQDTREVPRMTRGIALYGLQADGSETGLELIDNPASYRSGTGKAILSDGARPLLRQRQPGGGRPGDEIEGTFRTGSEVSIDASGAVFRQRQFPAGADWVLLRSEFPPVDAADAVQGDRHYHAAPVAGGTIGTVCVTGGKTAQIAWTATTVYSAGEVRRAGPGAYSCTVGGTSSTAAPSHTSGTAVDGTVTWLYLGAAAVHKGFGGIQN